MTAEQRKEISFKIKKQTIGYIVAALSLVAGLAWNDAIKSLIDTFVHVPSNSVIAKFLYAALATIIIAIVSTYLLRLTMKREE